MLAPTADEAILVYNRMHGTVVRLTKAIKEDICLQLACFNVWKLEALNEEIRF